VLVGGEQGAQPLPLPIGEQVRAGVQGAAGTVERVVLATAVTMEVLLNPSGAAVQRVAGQAHDVEGVHDRGRVGELIAGGGLEIR
jgi:hypothetical protein